MWLDLVVLVQADCEIHAPKAPVESSGVAELPDPAAGADAEPSRASASWGGSSHRSAGTGGQGCRRGGSGGWRVGMHRRQHARAQVVAVMRIARHALRKPVKRCRGAGAKGRDHRRG